MSSIIQSFTRFALSLRPSYNRAASSHSKKARTTASQSALPVRRPLQRGMRYRAPEGDIDEREPRSRKNNPEDSDSDDEDGITITTHRPIGLGIRFFEELFHERDFMLSSVIGVCYNGVADGAWVRGLEDYVPRWEVDIEEIEVTQVQGGHEGSMGKKKKGYSPRPLNEEGWFTGNEFY